MVVPRKIKVEKPVKLIFAGGFLGSGKTTALAALAKRLIERGMRVGLITNDQTENLVDTVIAKQMLSELGVPIEEVVKGCFCCRFDELMDHMEKILAHNPDVLMGEPVGSCTDFVAAVANPIKIGYREAFRFAPFSIMVDPDRVRELLLEETETNFPEEVAYLFGKQMEEADIIALNKIDLLSGQETERLQKAIEEKFPEKNVIAVSATEGNGMDGWLEELLSGRPGANTVLRQIDYDRYATAEAVLGWLNAAVKLSASEPLDAAQFARTLALGLREAFKGKDAEIGHLKFVITSGGKVMWTNVTKLDSEPSVSGEQLGMLSQGTLILNARVRLEPEELESIVRHILDNVCKDTGVHFEIEDLQCFSPAYPEPPYIVRESVEGAA
jgi:G3E family GTPase